MSNVKQGSCYISPALFSDPLICCCMLCTLVQCFSIHFVHYFIKIESLTRKKRWALFDTQQVTDPEAINLKFILKNLPTKDIKARKNILRVSHDFLAIPFCCTGDTAASTHEMAPIATIVTTPQYFWLFDKV